MAVKSTIKEIIIVTNVGVEDIAVGVNGVAIIKDNSIEWENSIDFIFAVFDANSKLLRQIINCPVSVIYQ